IAPVDVLVEQLKRVRHFALTSRFDVGLIPAAASLSVAPPPAFYLFDRRVYIELPHGDLWLLSRSNACHVYKNLFEELSRVALRGEELAVKATDLLNQLR